MTQPNIHLASRVIACLSATLALLTIPIPWDGLLFSSAQNSAHILLFFCLGYAGTKVSKLKGLTLHRAMIVTFAVLSCLGLLAEAAQLSLSGRSADFADIAMNTAGTLLGISTFIVLDYQPLMPTWITAFLCLLIAAIILVLLRPTLSVITAYTMRSELPHISNFSDPLATIFFSSVGGARLKHIAVSERLSKTVKNALRVEFSSAPFSGFSHNEPHPNWGDYREFTFVIYNPDHSSLELNLRINDKNHNNEYADRFNSVHTISPGLSEVSIPISKIQNMGQKDGRNNRTMNLSEISRIEFFTRAQYKPVTLDFFYLRLAM